MFEETIRKREEAYHVLLETLGKVLAKLRTPKASTGRPADGQRDETAPILHSK